MKQKIKLAFQLNSEEITNTHLVMSPNGKHVALVMRDSLVIAHDMGDANGKNPWLIIYVTPTDYSMYLSTDPKILLDRMQQYTRFDCVVDDVAISDLGGVSLLRDTHAYKELVIYTTKNLKQFLNKFTPYLETKTKVSYDTYSMQTIQYRPLSNDLYVVDHRGRLIDYTKQSVVGENVYGHLAINPKGKYVVVKYVANHFYYLSAYGKYLATVTIPTYENYNHATIDIKPIEGNYVKTSLIMKNPAKTGYWIPSVNVSDNGRVFWVCNEHDLKSKSCNYSVMLSMHKAKNGYTEWSEMSYYINVRRLAACNSFQIDRSGMRVAYVSTTNRLIIADMVE